MPINIQSIEGDIIEIEPSTAELVALWVYNGFNVRWQTWNRAREMYGALAPLDQPWVAAEDQVFEVNPPDKMPRYIYIFSNRANMPSLPTLGAVHDAVVRCLDRAEELGMNRVAMIQIPSAPGGRQPNCQQKLGSAAVMIAAIQRWGEAHPTQLTDVYLVDLKGKFGPLLSPTPPPQDNVPVPE
jgi:hypothetical protein